MTFNKDAFFEAGDTSSLAPVDLGEQIGTLYVRPIPFSDFERVREQAGENASEVDQTLYLVVLCACDENGEPAFSFDDVPRLRTQSLNVLQPLLNKANEVNGFDQSPEALEGKSDGTQS